MSANLPSRPEEREDPETVRIVLERLQTADQEQKRDDRVLDEIVRKRKNQSVSR